MTHMRLLGTRIVACALVCIYPTWSHAEVGNAPQATEDTPTKVAAAGTPSVENACAQSEKALAATNIALRKLQAKYDKKVIAFRRALKLERSRTAPDEVMTQVLDAAVLNHERTANNLGLWSSTLLTKRGKNVTEAGIAKCQWKANELTLVQETLTTIVAAIPDIIRSQNRVPNELESAWEIPETAEPAAAGVKAPDAKTADAKTADAKTAIKAAEASTQAESTNLAKAAMDAKAAEAKTSAVKAAEVSTEAESTDLAKAAADARAELESPAISRPAAATERTQAEVEFSRGDVVRYGLTASLLRVHALRNPAAPGRERSYEPTIDLVPGELGFQFTVAPHYSPMRLRTKDGGSFQVIGVGGMLLVEPHFTDERKRSSLAVAAFLSFLDDTIGVGVGFDLYRAVPVRGADGQSGTAFAQTGLLSWAMSPTGEITPENLLFLVTVNASGIAAALVNKEGGAK